MGFIPDIERICKMIPFTRQTLFFTATMPTEIRRITEAFLHNPQRVEVSKPATTAVTVTQLAVSADAKHTRSARPLRQLIRSAPDFKNAIIFCNRKREVAVLHKSLVKHGFGAVALHGDLDQSARTAALEQFRKGETQLLVASDVAARGLDIPDVSHIFNFDVPHHPDDYVHRVGRTGRAGRSGTAISLVSPADEKSLAAIERLTGQDIPRSKDTTARAAPSQRQPSDEHPERERTAASRCRSAAAAGSATATARRRSNRPTANRRRPLATARRRRLTAPARHRLAARAGTALSTSAPSRPITPTSPPSCCGRSRRAPSFPKSDSSPSQAARFLRPSDSKARQKP